MPDTFQTANLIAILLGGRRPQWVSQSGYTGRPDGNNDGVALESTTRSQIAVDLRRDVSRRTVSVVIDSGTVDLTGTYQVTVNGNVVNYDAAVGTPADEAELLTQWAAAIEADGTVGPLVIAAAEDTNDDGVVDTLFIRGDTNTAGGGVGEVDWSFGSAVTVGTATITATLDSVSADALLWTTAQGVNPPNPAAGATVPGSLWRQPSGGTWSVTNANYVERFDVSGLARAYVELQNLVGFAGDAAGAGATHVQWVAISHGPAINEAVST